MTSGEMHSVRKWVEGSQVHHLLKQAWHNEEFIPLGDGIHPILSRGKFRFPFKINIWYFYEKLEVNLWWMVCTCEGKSISLAPKEPCSFHLLSLLTSQLSHKTFTLKKNPPALPNCGWNSRDYSTLRDPLRFFLQVSPFSLIRKSH